MRGDAASTGRQRPSDDARSSSAKRLLLKLTALTGLAAGGWLAVNLLSAPAALADAAPVDITNVLGGNGVIADLTGDLAATAAPGGQVLGVPVAGILGVGTGPMGGSPAVSAPGQDTGSPNASAASGIGPAVAPSKTESKAGAPQAVQSKPAVNAIAFGKVEQSAAPVDRHRNGQGSAAVSGQPMSAKPVAVKEQSGGKEKPSGASATGKSSVVDGAVAASAPSATPPELSVGGLLGSLADDHTAVGALTSGLVAPVVRTVEPAVAPVVRTADSVVAPIVAPLDQAVTPIVETVSPAVGAVASVVQPVTAPAGRLVGPVSELVHPVTESLSPVIRSVDEKVRPVAAPLTSRVVPVVGTVVEQVVAPVAAGVVDTAGPALDTVAGVDAVVTGVRPVTELVGGTVAAVTDGAAAPVVRVIQQTGVTASVGGTISSLTYQSAPAPGVPAIIVRHTSEGQSATAVSPAESAPSIDVIAMPGLSWEPAALAPSQAAGVGSAPRPSAPTGDRPVLMNNGASGMVSTWSPRSSAAWPVLQSVLGRDGGIAQPNVGEASFTAITTFVPAQGLGRIPAPVTPIIPTVPVPVVPAAGGFGGSTAGGSGSGSGALAAYLNDHAGMVLRPLGSAGFDGTWSLLSFFEEPPTSPA